MRRSPYIGKEPDFQKIIAVSAVLHLFFIFAVTIPLKTKERDFRSYSVNLVTPTQIERPVKTRPAKKKVKSKAAPVKVKKRPRKRVKAKTKPKSGVTLKSAEEAKKKTELVRKEIERIRALSAISRQKERAEEQLAKDKEHNAEIASAIEKLRKKKAGTVTSGPAVPGTGDSKSSSSYRALISQIIYEQWGYPANLHNTSLETIISFQMDDKGNVVTHEIEESSGNISFDRSALKAILNSSPLPPHPVEREITVRFRL